MTSEQLLPAFVASLVKAGVRPSDIERAVSLTRDIKLGQPYAADPLIRAFAHEQVGLLERAIT